MYLLSSDRTTAAEKGISKANENGTCQITGQRYLSDTVLLPNINYIMIKQPVLASGFSSKIYIFAPDWRFGAFAVQQVCRHEC